MGVRKTDVLKRMAQCLQSPAAWVAVLAYATAFSTLALSAVAIVMGDGGGAVAVVIYVLALLSSVYAAYITTGYASKFRQRVIRAADKYLLTRKLRNNYRFRTMLFSLGSFAGNVAYTVFLCGTALYTQTLWYWVVALYYILVTSVRGGILIDARTQRRTYKNNERRLREEQVRSYRHCGLMLFVLAFVFAGAVAQMVVDGRRFPAPHIMLALFAAITCYRVATSCYNYFKAKRYDDLVLRAVRNINFTTALVSVLTLQTLWFDAYPPVNISVPLFNGITGAVVCGLMITVGVSMLVRAKRTRKLLAENQSNNKNDEQNNEKKGVVNMKKYYVGIDLGGTFIKGGIVDQDGVILLQGQTPTESEKGAEGVANNIASLALDLLGKAGVDKRDAVGIGMGVPGMIDSKNGVVIYSNNLNWKDFEIGARVAELTGLQTKIANDANVAALGEAKFGAAKGRENVVMLTLGTGVGGGIVADGRLVEGNKSAGAELGHAVITIGGEQCTCGRKGCLEAYASATALIRDTKRAMEAHRDSKMWEIGGLEKVTGKTAFDYRDSDPYANTVVENYIRNLASGITNFANIFRPEVVLLGGGVCAQGENLVKPLQKLLNEELFAGGLGPQVEIKIAELGNSAGLLGAAALLM